MYGDLPNYLPLIELEQRLELPEDHRYHRGIDTSMSIDASTHSLFGVSKASADLLVQEYGRYFGMPTVCFRGGCLTGPNHAGDDAPRLPLLPHALHDDRRPYTVFGYGGKQVRDNIHSADLVAAFEAFHRAPRSAAVYNIGGGRASNCSMLEAIAMCEEIAGTRAPVGAVGPEPHRRPPVVDLRPRAVSARLSRVGHHLRRPGRAARNPRPERRAVAGGAMKLSVVIPAHNEVGSIGQTVESTVHELERAEIDYEILVIDDASGDGTGDVVRQAGASATRTCAASAPTSRRASATPFAPGSMLYTGDAVAIMMADLSDSPKDLVLYYRVLEQGYDCAFGTRFGNGGARTATPG